jgi:hypothetical protein
MSSLIATINRDSAGWMKGIKASVATEPQRAVWPVQTVPDQADNPFAHMPGFASDMTVMLCESGISARRSRRLYRCHA